MESLVIYTAKREAILVDEQDFKRLSAHSWCLNASGYAVRTQKLGGGKWAPVLMHRELMGMVPNDGLVSDHINCDRLDNRRSNLRVVTRAQNQYNRGTRKDSASGIKGIYKVPGQNRWKPYIMNNWRKVNLGTFTDLALAIEFRQLAAEMLHGDYVNHGALA